MKKLENTPFSMKFSLPSLETSIEKSKVGNGNFIEKWRVFPVFSLYIHNKHLLGLPKSKLIYFYIFIIFNWFIISVTSN